MDAGFWAALTLGLGLCVQALLRERPRWGLMPAALAALGWLSLLPASTPTREGSGPDLLLLTLDTLRADQLQPDRTPRLLAFAERARRYDNAVSTAPLTAPAHASMLTGLSSPEHGLTANGDRVEAASVVSALKEAGYATAAFLSSKVLDRGTGLNEGFQLYADAWTWRARQGAMPGVAALLGGGRGERRGDHTVEQALSWWQATEGPRMAWVHLYDAHAPYAPPKEWMPDEATRLRVQSQVQSTAAPEGLGDWMHSLPERHAAGQRALYEAEVRWTDELAGRLLEGVGPDTVVLVLADHGEGFGEHGDSFVHGGNLFEPVMRVPLLVRWPGALSPGRSDELVSVRAVAGTLASAASVSWPTPGLGQEDRVLAFTPGQQSRAGPRDQEPELLASVRRADSKLILGSTTPASHFALDSDPAELSPGAPSDAPPEDLSELRTLMAAPPEPLGSEAQRRLEALGYF